MPWITAVTQPTTYVEGQVVGSVREAYARFTGTAGIRAGLVCQRGAVFGQAAPLAALAALDADSIVTLAAGIVPVVAGQTVQDVAGAPGGVLNGVVGFRRIFNPRRITYTFSAHANWGLAAQGWSWGRTLGLDADGRYHEEDWTFPAGGGVTITTDTTFAQHLATLIGPCDGAGGGTLTIGTAGGAGSCRTLGKLDYGIAAYERAIEPSATATLTFDVTDPMVMVKDGLVAAIVETTAALAVTEGDPVAVRVVAAALDVTGQMTRWGSEAQQSGNFALLSGAYWATAAAAGAPALVRIGG